MSSLLPINSAHSAPQITTPSTTSPLNDQKIQAVASQAIAFATGGFPELEMRQEMEICKLVGEKEQLFELVIGLKNKKDIELSRETGMFLAQRTKSKTAYFDTVHYFKAQGGASYMQDLPIFGELQDPTSSLTIRYLGVLDGHGLLGESVAKLVKESLIGILQDLTKNKPFSQISDADMNHLIKEVYRKLNAEIKKYKLANAGTTASIGFQLGRKVFVANVGDSRILLLKKDGTFIQCTEDGTVGSNKHKVAGLSRFGREVEKKVSGFGELVSSVIHFANKTWRLINQNGYGINLASTMGDWGLPYALREPKISGPYQIESEDRLLAASDGVFDLIPSVMVNEICKDKATKEIPNWLGHVSLGVAFRTYSEQLPQVDNTVVLIADLAPSEIVKSEK